MPDEHLHLLRLARCVASGSNVEYVTLVILVSGVMVVESVSCTAMTLGGRPAARVRARGAAVPCLRFVRSQMNLPCGFPFFSRVFAGCTTAAARAAVLSCRRRPD